jgi:hypothetical protein
MKPRELMPDERPCCVPGCLRRGRNKGFQKGVRRYDKFCEVHHKERLRPDHEIPGLAGKQQIQNDHCEKCGWSESSCDRHRIDPSKGYFRENVIVLCPNCHRVEHHPKK